MTELEKAATEELLHSYATIIDGELAYQRQAMLTMFRKGAEWQSKQSSWISVEERLPDSNEMVLCLMKSNGAIVSGFIQIIRDHKPKVLTSPNFEFEDNMDYEPAYWMPIPELQKGGQNEQ